MYEMIFLLKSIWVIALVFHIVISIAFNISGNEKGYDNQGWWVFFFGIFGMIKICSLPDRKLQEQNERIISLLGEK